MKKLINRPENFVAEMLDGLVKAHPDQLAFAGEPVAIVRADAPVQGKVALATGGGSGHLPVFLGYVGRGLLDGCAVGDVFASPSTETMLDVTRRIHGGKGVVYIYGNYGGDVMNFDMAAEMAAMEDIEVRTVLVRDDVASAPPAEAARRRGVAGMVFAFKVAGAKAEAGRQPRRGRRRRGEGARQPAHDGRGALALHGAAGRQADVHDRRRRDGDRHGHPRRAGREARGAGDRRRGGRDAWPRPSSPISEPAQATA